VITLFQNNLLFTEGTSILFVLIMLGILGMLTYRTLLYIACLGLLFCLFFFRNPDRLCIAVQTDTSVLICPADGQVVDIQYDGDNGIEGYAQKVSIFLSPLDVHVNWIPMAGIVKEINYKPGKFMMAFLPKSSELNECNDIILMRADGKQITVRQIAGTVARRICCWIHTNQQVSAGEKYGMIRFGSRVDVLLPQDVFLEVGLGQKVYGGQTVLGRWQ